MGDFLIASSIVVKTFLTQTQQIAEFFIRIFIVAFIRFWSILAYKSF